jgi:hypothetical protein
MDAQRDERERFVGDDDTTPDEERPILCVVCEHVLTTEAEAIAVDGHHAHRRVNPAGFVFDIRCFGAAPGVVPIGAPEHQHSWFTGAAWQVGLCRSCEAHVGWTFSGREASFVALIADRVREP